MFRLKIILLSVLISGSVLIGFGLYFLSVINKAGMERIDSEILALGGTQLHATPPREHWLDFAKSLQFISDGKRLKDQIIQITAGPKKEIFFQSPNWPQEISEELFPEFDQEMRPPPGPNEPLLRIPSVKIKKAFFQTIKTSTGTWRVAIMGNQRVTVLVGMNMAGFISDAERFNNAFLIVLPLALLLLAAGGWVVADRAMRPVALITRTAEGITAQALDQRIPEIDSGTELSRLVNVINSMLERLEKSFSQAVRFSADAAHELQTPLTILQGELDDAVQHAPIDSEEQRRYSALLEEVQRLKSIVQKLLILARADAGKLNLRLELVDLSAMIESASEDAGAIAPHLRIEKEIAPGVMVKADTDLLRQVIQNLTSNAAKYNVQKGLVRFRLRARVDTVHVTISNTGDPIPAEDQKRIFDRFYRVDKSRNNAIAGTGLGLSLAREIVHAHQGTLSLDSGPGNLVSFTLSLPCVSGESIL